MAKSRSEFYVNNLYSFYSGACKTVAALAVAPSAIGIGASMWCISKAENTYRKLTEDERLIVTTALFIAAAPLSIPTIKIAIFTALPVIAPVLAAVGPYVVADDEMLNEWMEPCA